MTLSSGSAIPDMLVSDDGSNLYNGCDSNSFHLRALREFAIIFHDILYSND